MLRAAEGLSRFLGGDKKGRRPGLLNLHTRSRDAKAIQYHYDVSNEFYALFLDREMVYSCAYFKTGDEDIHTAQAQKLDHICRKLRLEPGDRFLDIGCGWGALVRWAAKHYGVDATGITLSPAGVKAHSALVAWSRSFASPVSPTLTAPARSFARSGMN